MTGRLLVDHLLAHPSTAGPERMDRFLAELERGKGLLTSQAYEELHVVEDGGLVMMELAWRGVLAVPLGRLAAGDAMTCRSVLCFEVLDGRIASQRNHDCFDPF